MTKCISIQDLRVLSDDELDHVNGGAVLEFGIGPVTIQINPDSGCFAVWYGKGFVGGACKK
jgi:bacteriocin-like protein